MDLPNNAVDLKLSAESLDHAVRQHVLSQFDDWCSLHALMQWLRTEHKRTRGGVDEIWLRADHFPGIQVPLTTKGKPAVAIDLANARLCKPGKPQQPASNQYVIQLALCPELLDAGWHRMHILLFAGVNEGEVASLPA
jgi:hypothetical protein